MLLREHYGECRLGERRCNIPRGMLITRLPGMRRPSTSNVGRPPCVRRTSASTPPRPRRERDDSLQVSRPARDDSLHVPGSARRALHVECSVVADLERVGGLVQVARVRRMLSGAPGLRQSWLCHMCNRIIVAMSISLDAKCGHSQWPVPNENAAHRFFRGSHSERA